MSIFTERGQSRSPLIGAAELAEFGDLPEPAPHTEAELGSLMALLTRPKSRIETISVGHSRDAHSRTAAGAFSAAWKARGGTVLTVVDWPESAASWLRPANRLTAERPDAWVMAAAPVGFAQLARRLRRSTDWDPAHTLAFASLRDSRLPALAGPDTLHGLRGATAEGGTWDVHHRRVTSYPPAGVTA
ncbi:substrate-binding family protein [Kitasatospora sp. SolWspMP-SS2h]|uniref:ABC transporter substrate-binding protein n=1 Tax=Kitasatospora sp. SolWspMP-SS2h TaxID=1305729 RepID=UPI000DBA824A|nr:ABC transporter substrate-binding protein [Kitasatospora sp. SolWspMP-SS2h]RAJ38355.1 substrate-binding family protein [Kitasatospora sp. SolWspMP-SS2h]